MKIVIENVESIKRGFATTIEFGYSQEFWDAEQLATGRIRVSFRHKQASPVLWTADTEDGTITRPGNRKFEIALPASATASMLPEHVQFDLVRGAEDEARAVPGYFLWPVETRVTENA